MKKTGVTWIKTNAHFALCFALAIVIFVINFRIVGDCSSPFVFNDEAGYWTHAAIFSGRDWSGVSDGLIWYSFGYSILIAPLIKIISNTAVLYQSALCLNILMLIVTYFIYSIILREIFPKIGKCVSYVASAAAVLYTSYQIQSGIAWSETALVLVTTLLIYFVILVVKKPNYVKLGVLGALSAYIYMIHNRCMGIVAAVILVVVLMLVSKKLTWRHVAVFFAVLVIGLVFNKLIKIFLENTVWGEAGRPSGNDLESVSGKLKIALTSVDGFKRLLSVVASQSFAVFISAICIPLFTLWGMLKSIVCSIIDAVKSKKNIGSIWNTHFFVYVFVFCSFEATLFISSVFMLDFTRIDHILYTRYIDMFVGMMIAFGLCMLLSTDKKDTIFIAIMPVLIFLGINRTEVMLDYVTVPIFNTVCAPGIATMYSDYELDFSKYFMIAVSVWSLILFLILILKKRHIGIYIASVICAVFFVYNTAEGYTIIRENQNFYAENSKLITKIKSLPAKSIYVTKNCGTFRYFCQYSFMDTTVKVTSDVNSIAEDSYIIADATDLLKYSEYDLLDYSDNHIVLSNEVKIDNDAFKKIPLEIMYTFGDESNNEIISSVDSSNYLCFGPYFNVDLGNYIFKVDVTVNEAESYNIGYVECRSSESDIVYSHVELNKSMLDNSGNYVAELYSEFAAPVQGLELIVFINQPEIVNMQLNSIEYMEVK